MGLALDRLLRLFSATWPAGNSGRGLARMDFRRLSARDLADINLPPEIGGRARAQADAEDLRRRAF